MSEEEEAAPSQSIQARITALNLGQVGRAPGTSAPASTLGNGPGHVKPLPPALPTRTRTANYPPLSTSGSVTDRDVGNEPNSGRRNGDILPPPGVDRDRGRNPSTSSQASSYTAPPRLPPRRDSSQSSPALPPRRPLEYSNTRRDSAGSTSSSISTISTLSVRPSTLKGSRSASNGEAGPRIKAPEYDQSSLPALLTRRTKMPEPRQSAIRNISTQNLASAHEPESPAPSLPPRLPTRRAESASSNGRRLPPETPLPVPDHSTFSRGRKLETQDPPNIPTQTSNDNAEEKSTIEPPPIPLSSRPKPISNAKPSETLKASDAAHCLKCRDYSEPDSHAARFPRQSIPNLNTSWLANQLTQPFSSPTDKARVLFTWLHHNIDYNVRDFLNHSVKPSTPENTLRTGLAVCEGYAGLFNALALQAGLQSLVTGGHGKGVGFATPGPHDPVPPFAGNHAWNAVYLPDTTGGWHLIDSTWGAGTLDMASRQYNKGFNPSWFTMDSEEFSTTHYPEKREHWFLPPSVSPPSWQEYMVGKGAPPMLYSSPTTDHGIAALSIQPALKQIPVSPLSPLYIPTTRFMFNLVCPHFEPAVHGKGPSKVFLLGIHNQHGRGGDDNLVFETNGKVWWVDVPTAHLGRQGQGIMCYAVETVDGEDASGMSVEELKRAKGRKAMSFSGVVGWDLG
jgi:transglutaminase-like putative cysteine protease